MNVDVDIISILQSILESLGGIEHIARTVELSLACIGVFILAKVTSRRLIDV